MSIAAAKIDVVAIYSTLLGVRFDESETQADMRRLLQAYPPGQHWFDPNSVVFQRRVETGRYIDSHPLLRNKMRSAFPLHGFYVRAGVPVRIVYHDTENRLTVVRGVDATHAGEWSTLNDPEAELQRVDCWTLDHLKRMYRTVGYAGYAKILNFCDPLSFTLYCL